MLNPKELFPRSLRHSVQPVLANVSYLIVRCISRQVRMSSNELAPLSVRQERERLNRKRIREVREMSQRIGGSFGGEREGVRWVCTHRRGAFLLVVYLKLQAFLLSKCHDVTQVTDKCVPCAACLSGGGNDFWVFSAGAEIYRTWVHQHQLGWHIAAACAWHGRTIPPLCCPRLPAVDVWQFQNSRPKYFDPEKFALVTATYNQMFSIQFP